MSKIIIAADSTCDLSPELREKYDIRILPLHVIMGGRSYDDGVDLMPQQILNCFQRSGELPKTAAITPGEYTDFFEKIKKEADQVIFFSISSGFSSTYQNAAVVAADMQGIYAIDSHNLSTGIGLQVLKAAEFARQGMEAPEIIHEIAEISDKVDASFVIDTLEFLYKGGRCSAHSAIGASMLNLKPCIYVRDGLMHVGKKYIGSLPRILPKYAEDRLSNVNVESGRVFITHSIMTDPGYLSSVKQNLESMGRFKEILITSAGCTITSHCGQNTLGVLFIREE